MLRPLTLACLATLAVSANAQLVLPFAGTDSTATLSAFQITKSGTSGRANTLYITNATNTSDALLVNTVGLGRAGYFTITNPANNQIGLRADSNGSGTSMFGFMTGTGRAGFFRITNSGNSSPALMAQTNGAGPALSALAGIGLAGDFTGDVRISGASLNSLQVIGGISATAGVTAVGFNGSGSNLTQLNASNLSQGTISDARLSPNVPLRDVPNTFVGGTETSPSVAFSIGTVGLFGGSGGIGFSIIGEKMRLTSAGRLGVGTKFPSKRVHIVGDNGPVVPTPTIGSLASVVIENSDSTGIQIISNPDQSENIIFGSGSSGYRMNRLNSTNDFGIFAGVSSPRIYIQGASGNVGIKTSAPSTALHVIGTITGTAKNFLIDHPQDPYNKTLRHACIESDEYKNVYDGTIVTDARGFATVTMPEWFESLNSNFRYQLTVIDDGDDFVQAKITREIENNRFTIRTSAPRVKVSWMVTGVRKDAYVRDNPLVVEQVKPAKERGTLLYEGAAERKKRTP